MTISPDRIFISRSPGETRAALVAGERLLEIVHLRDAEAQTGAVYAGRVGEKLAGSTDVFIEIGVAPAGILETKGQKLTTGQLIAVEVLTPARADKGHKLKLSAVPVPEAVTTSRLLRAAAHPVAAWAEIHQHSLREIVVEPAALKQSLAQVINSALITTDIPDDVGWLEIEEQIDEALQTEVALKSGGRIRIEQTSALTSIDIDAGSSSIHQANTEAMAAIAHHMRLRNLAGHIVVDLIHIKGKQQFVQQLKAAVATDPVETRVMGLTPSGMIDIVRQRTRPSLSEILQNTESVAYRALRLACRELVARRAAKIQINVAPAVATVLNEQLRSAYEDAVETAKGEIIISAQPTFPLNRIEVGA